MKHAGTTSASSSTTSMISRSHLFNISGYLITKELPTGKYIMSSPFVVGGFSWAIRYYPNGIDSYDDPGIAFTLELQSEATDDIEVRLEFCLVNLSGRPLHAHKVSSFYKFGYESCNRGFSGFISQSELEGSGYLKDNSFMVKCMVDILGSRATELSDCPDPDGDTIQADLSPPSDLHKQL